MKCTMCGRTINTKARYFRDLDDTGKYYHGACLKRAGYKRGPRTPDAKNPRKTAHDWQTPITCPKCGNTNADTLEDRYGQKMLCLKCGTEFEWAANPRNPKVALKCNECGRVFKKSIGPRTFEVKCPGCGGYDVEPLSQMQAYSTFENPEHPRSKANMLDALEYMK